MTTDEFIALVCEEFDFDESPRLSVRLVEDLGFDSLNLFDLVVLMEELAGCTDEDIVNTDYPILETLGDAYQYLNELVREHLKNTGMAKESRLPVEVREQ